MTVSERHVRSARFQTNDDAVRRTCLGIGQDIWEALIRTNEDVEIYSDLFAGRHL